MRLSGRRVEKASICWEALARVRQGVRRESLAKRGVLGKLSRSQDSSRRFFFFFFFLRDESLVG